MTEAGKTYEEIAQLVSEQVHNTVYTTYDMVVTMQHYTSALQHANIFPSHFPIPRRSPPFFFFPHFQPQRETKNK